MKALRPETRSTIIAGTSCLLMIILLVVDLGLGYRQTLNEAEDRLRHFNLTMVEHTARSLETVRVLLREIAKDLQTHHPEWRSWDAAEGWEYLAQRHTRTLPQIRHMILFDQNGDQKFVSTVLQAPTVNITDRTYFKLLQQGSESSQEGPYTSRNTGIPTYSQAQRVAGERGEFAGVLLASNNPADFQEFCWPHRLDERFEAVLTNAEGKIIAACRPGDISAQTKTLGASAEDVLFDGRLKAHIPENGIAHQAGLLIMRTAVPGFRDLFLLAAIPENVLLQAWRTRCYTLSLLALLMGGVLLGGAWRLRQQLAAMKAITEQLETSQRELENGIAQATQKLAQQKEAAERSDTAKSRFLAAASHDLRQPLHALGLFAADLRHQVKMANYEELPRLTQQITLSASSLSELLNTLLDISRLDVNGIHVETKDFPLKQLFSRLEEASLREANERNIKLRFHKRTQFWLETDPALLDRILGNLITNALRYTPAGGKVLVGARRHGHDQVLLEVRDNGIGISKEHQEHIFSEFYQVGNQAREHHKGVGLGLSIVRRLTDALHITIKVNSHPSMGSNFQLLVPRCLVPPKNLATPAQQIKQAQVWCIGTSAEMQTCESLLTRWGFGVQRFLSMPEQAVHYQALIIVDGEYAQAINAQLVHGTPLIVIPGDESWPIPRGAHVLNTPIRPAKLRALVDQLHKALSKLMA